MATATRPRYAQGQGSPWIKNPEVQEKRRAEGKAKAEAALSRLDSMVEKIATDNEAFAEYLRLSGQMHDYSWGNRLLIMLQRPDAGIVAGFHRWKELGRPVKKGSKGIQILAPMVVKTKDDDDDDGRRVVGFRVAYVFAAADTDGPPIGLPVPIAETDDGPEARAALAYLERRAGELGVPVSYETREQIDGVMPGAGGYYLRDEGRIVVLAGTPAAARAKTLAHELAHHIAHTTGEHGNSRPDHETVAEGAAFVACSNLGLDTSGYSAPYIAAWAGKDGHLARVKTLLQNIAKVAAEIGDSEQHACYACGATFAELEENAKAGCAVCR